ncbi:TPA: hypothetical protein STY79_002982 [Clostridioides difficile]|nr:hypothetical protein [Clostridioides difficile]HBF5466436.1 hypothetical protein [Clostridioides difficile]HBF5556664.1 hypothetical protein [Clostridioides difficile]HBF5591224.1 hypothetical protein [Clostridioides difficile]HBF5602682.1 hypothetical protein [Clostridioides difficile]
MKIKYVVDEGYITSKSDGEEHFINFRDLIKLYGVSPRECIRAKDYYEREGLDLKDIKFLYPRNDGKYKL